MTTHRDQREQERQRREGERPSPSTLIYGDPAALLARAERIRADYADTAERTPGMFRRGGILAVGMTAELGEHIASVQEQGFTADVGDIAWAASVGVELEDTRRFPR